MIAPYRGVVIQPLVYRYFSPQSSVKFFSLLNLRIILRPGVQTNRRQSSRPHCCSTVNRDVIICPKDKSRFAVSENLLRRCMAADYDNILKISLSRPARLPYILPMLWFPKIHQALRVPASIPGCLSFPFHMDETILCIP